VRFPGLLVWFQSDIDSRATALTFLDLSAIARGVDSNLAFYLVAIANLASGAGRICAGVMSDKTGECLFATPCFPVFFFFPLAHALYSRVSMAIGPINIMAPFTTLTVILIYCWPFVKGVGGFIIFAILYG
jgi:MFS transporter, MCT family, solute carrier family 16 (monocarboxylic acid transporters), member 10